MEEYVIKVHFAEPINGQTDYYFGSLAAIYQRFTVKQIGCKLQALWAAKISLGHPKVTRRCIISKHVVERKPRKDKDN